MDSVKDDEQHEERIMLELDENGEAHRIFKLEVCFFDELELDAFMKWLKTKDDEFYSWLEGVKKLRGTECESCKWCDPTQSQCYDGHMQGIGPCGGYEEEE